MWTFTVGQDFTLGNSLFVAVKLTAYVDPDKYIYSGHVIVFDASESFSFFDSSGSGKGVIISDADMSSSVRIDNKKKYILILH